MASTFGFIGLGIMGQGMAQSILSKGLSLHVWNRSTGKAKDLLQGGAIWTETPALLAEACDTIILCLTDHDAVSSVLFGADGVASAANSKVKTIIDCSTIGPDHAKDVAALLQQSGISYIDAPVSGGPEAAAKGELIIMAGGNGDQIAAQRPVFDAMSTRLTHMGPTGAGQMTKLCNQMIVGINTAAMSEVMRFAAAAGVDTAQLPSALEGGFADSKPLQLFGPRMASGVTTPKLGDLGMMQKDLQLAQEQVVKYDQTAPTLSQVVSLFDKAVDTLGWDADITQIVEYKQDPVLNSGDPSHAEVANPYDPLTRTDLSANEKTIMRFMSDCMHGDDLSLIDSLVAEDYIQHTPGIGQGREGVRKYISEIAYNRPGRKNWRPIQLFECGNIVILHKLLQHVIIADFMRFNEQGEMAEHWDVVQPLPEPGYDPMRLSQENLARFRALFGIKKPSE